MKHVLLYAPALLLAGMLSFCKNNAPEKPTTEFIPERTDSLFGLKGCDRAGFRMLSATEHEFVYQDFTVHITRKADGSDDIKAVRTDSTTSDLTILHESPSYFRGSTRGQLFVEEDKGPGNREMAVYHVKRQALMFRTIYCGDMEIQANGTLRFLVPVEESEVSKMPECPERKEWEEKGLNVGYGQRCLYSLVSRMLTKKSEFACVALDAPSGPEKK